MLCPQCGKSIENLSTKVSLCENCLALKEEELSTSSSETPDEQEMSEQENAEKKPVNGKVKKSNIKIAVIFIILILAILVVILVNTLSSEKSKEQASPKKVSALLESFSKEKSEVVPPASPDPTPASNVLAPIPSPEEVAITVPEQEATIAETNSELVNSEQVNIDDLDASIKELETMDVTKTTEVITAPSEVISPLPNPTVEISITPLAGTTTTVISPTPQVSPSPEKTIDESKLSEFDRRVLHTKRLKELQKK
jgi:hypothetical protein